MRPALVTLIPMLAAAGFVLVGGERMARHEAEEHIPADRERLLGFAESLEEELDRLDALYQSHLHQFAADYALAPTRDDLREKAASLQTPRSIHFFDLFKKSWQGELSFLPVGSRERLPEIVLEGRDPPLNRLNGIELPKSLLAEDLPKASGWISAPDPNHRIHWSRPDLIRENSLKESTLNVPFSGPTPALSELTGLHVGYPVLVAVVVDWTDLHAQVRNHLLAWLEEPLTPLRESSERMEVRGPADLVLATTGEDDRGPAALIMPLRTSLGDWQLQAWDGVTVTSQHDTATLIGAGTLASILALGGLFLFVQQRRALQLAEERVSFVNRVSHELGSPLTNVALNLDLATEAVESSPPEARRRLGIVTEEVERLARLVANVLTFSRRERRALEIDPKPCIPDEVIGKTLSSFRPSLQRREIEIDWQAAASERVRLDPDALEQIVGNLISNVEKYTFEGRWLGIQSELQNEELVISVSDHGPGIPPTSRDLIFQAFERVHRKVNEGSSGTGLGLTISRELAARMGGSLNLLESTAGTRFELRLPAPAALAVVPEDKTSAA